jgi:hypothetical protein
MKNIHSICRKVAKLTDAEFAEVEAMAAEQRGYVHPLKMGTAARLHAAGNHNERVVAKLRELRDTILAGAPDRR